MAYQFTRIDYANLNSRQRESYNLQKVGAVLADFGFITIPLSDDWGNADFIAQHCDGRTFFKVQLKSRLTFSKDYAGKDLQVCFPSGADWYLFPHDEVLELIKQAGLIEGSSSWTTAGEYSFPTLSKSVREILEPYRIPVAI